MNVLNVGSLMIKHDLRGEAPETGRLGREFTSYELETLAFNEANKRIDSEHFGGVLDQFEIKGCVTCVEDLEGLVNTLSGAAGREENMLRGLNLDHR